MSLNFDLINIFIFLYQKSSKHTKTIKNLYLIEISHPSSTESFQEGGPGYNNPAQFAASLGASSGGASSSSFSGPIARSDFGASPAVGASDNTFQAQQMIEIPADNSAFRYRQ